MEPADPGGSLQAVMGTAIHDAVQQRLNETAAEGDLVEYPVVFAGVPGHVDRYEAATGDLVDVKTTSSRRLDHIRLHGPDRPHLFQTDGYAAALAVAGVRVRRIVIDYIARDTGELYRHARRPNPAVVREALAWLRSVRETDLDMLNREYQPDSPFCGHCPFRTRCWDGAVHDRSPLSVLFVEDPDQQRWAERLERARADKADAAKREAEAKGALDALRPDDETTMVDVGLVGKGLRWKTTTSNNIDIDRVRAEYAKVGARPPIKPSTSTKLVFAPLPDGE